MILQYLETIVAENNRLEDIEDKKIQIEYENVFNKGVKSVENKIKEKIKHYEELLQDYIEKYDTTNDGIEGMINVLKELLGDDTDE